MKFNVIGAGRLGKNIAYALSSIKEITLDSICNQSMISSMQACNELGIGVAVSSLRELPPTEVTLICSNDDAIAPIVSALAQYSVLKPDSLVIHCSGALNSDVLSPLKEQDCFIASMHPLKAFKTGYLDVQAFNKVHCIIEGDLQACYWLNNTFEQLGAYPTSIQAKGKTSYHAAATIASNYLITLAHCCEELLLQAGMTKEQARDMICSLMQGNINNLQQTANITETLTGPLTRGDTRTVSQHLLAIKNPLITELYKKAGLATLALTQLPEEKKQLMLEILKN